MNFSYDTLFDYCYVRNLYEKLSNLEEMIIPERWNYTNPHEKENQRNPILENYIKHTFRRLAFEYKECETQEDANRIIYASKTCSCFNTGLFTKTYEPVYAYMTSSKYDDDTKDWFFVDFMQESHPYLNVLSRPLPSRANYFKQAEDLIYNTDYELNCNSKHILEGNLERFPEEIRNLPYLLNIFEGATKIALKKVQANYKIAVPTFFKNKMCMLLPLDLTNTGNADLALAVERIDESRIYIARTCLTLDMAYNDARLIAKPDGEWLIP